MNNPHPSTSAIEPEPMRRRRWLVALATLLLVLAIVTYCWPMFAFMAADIMGFGLLVGLAITAPLLIVVALLTRQPVRSLMFSRYLLIGSVPLGMIAVLLLYLALRNADFR